MVGTDANGCKNSASQSVTVNPLPTVAITADGPTALCQGATVTLTASGAASYLWSPGGETTAAITVNAAGTYSVVGTDANGCKNSASQSVTVNPLPTVAITADGPTALCQGATVTLTASGATSYLGARAGRRPRRSRSMRAGTYSVVGTDANGCKNSASQSVTVNPLPTVAITADGPTALCQGATRDADGQWRDELSAGAPGGETTAAITVNAGWDLQRGGDRRQRVQE